MHGTPDGRAVPSGLAVSSGLEGFFGGFFGVAKGGCGHCPATGAIEANAFECVVPFVLVRDRRGGRWGILGVRVQRWFEADGALVDAFEFEEEAGRRYVDRFFRRALGRFVVQ